MYYANRLYRDGVIRNGLQLRLDAYNVNSYPGTGTTWFDISGNSYNGTLTNGVVPVNNAMQFDGVNDYINLGDVLDLGYTSGLTWSCWFKCSNVTLKRTMITKYGTPTSRGTYLNLTITTGAVDFGVSGDGLTSVGLITTGSYSDGQWHHASCIFTPSTSLQIFIDGIFVISNTVGIPAQLVNNSINLRMGVSNSNSNYMLGLLNDFMVYDRALTSAEIMLNYNSTKSKY